ncbi:MBL fold metallo-hydrolase [Piscibacillus sp. B03]|uniref:MBL fold metallo-hydrolase n=1 Tax=Piscibacillus sp. B03 TaxID=3457430 RepID=UPI003FCCF0CA
MFLKKRFELDVVNGVHMANGKLSFQGINLNVHCFYIDGVLIDTGSSSLESYLKPYYRQLDIDQVVLTHYHEDHTGCAAFLQKELDIPIYMSDIKLDYCKKKADYPLYRQFFWGRRKPFCAIPIGNSFESNRATWDVIKTPGHAIDHVSFLNNETGQLFTGDLFINEKTKVVLREENIPQLIDSIKRVLNYEFDEVFCCHAGYIREGRMFLNRKLEFLLDLKHQILKLNQEGKSIEEINRILFPRKYPITKLSFGEWDSSHIVRSIIEQT